MSLAVWIWLYGFLTHRHTEFCSLLSVFYHWFKCWKGDKEEEGGYEKIKIQASQILNLPSPCIQLSGTESKDHFKECKATEMVMLLSYICTCFTLCSFLYIISFVFHCKHSTGTDIPIWQIKILYPDRLRGLPWVPGQVYAKAGTKTHMLWFSVLCSFTACSPSLELITQ